MHRLPLVLSTAAIAVSTVAGVAATSPDAVGAPAPVERGRHAPAVLHLPDGFAPEGIAVAGRRVLVSNRTDGDIWAFGPGSRRGHLFAQGPGTPSLGLKVDRAHHRLFVAGGTGGDARVLDLRTGRKLAHYPLTSNPSFVNDAVIRPHAVWFTDSAQAQLYRLPLGRDGRLPRPGQVRSVPLTGQWRQVTGNNANGITATPNGRALLVVNSTSGLLYRVRFDGRARRVRLHGATLLNGDGMLLRGRTLLVVRNRDNQVAVVHLNRAGTEGRVGSTVSSPRFDTPSTVARRGRDLYLPNARFTTTPTPTTPYTVNRIRLP